ncbi:5344_t:CDS:2, partial [Ambispora gerdemannii]
NQAQGESVQMFWNTVELEIATMKEAEFAVNQSLTGNEANAILNETKLGFTLNQKNELVIGSKRTYPNEKSTPPNKEKNHSGNILPDGTKLTRLPPPPDFTSLSDGENDNPLMVDNDEEIPTLDSILSSPLPTNIQNWSLSSRKFVNEIFVKNISQHAIMLKNNCRREGNLEIWDVKSYRSLSSYAIMVSDIECQDMMKDYEEILKVPELIEVHCKAGKSSLYNVKDGNDLLDCGGEHHTEIDVIIKACAYIVNGLQNGAGIHCKWGESFCPLSQSASHEKGRKCDVRFLSPTRVFRSSNSKDLTDEQAGTIKVPFLQVAGIFGQLLVEDL